MRSSDRPPEGLSCGTLVVATPAGGNVEVLVPLDTGLVMKATDADSIGHFILQWSDHIPDTNRCRRTVTTVARSSPQIMFVGK